MHAVLGTELRDRQLAPDRLECYFRFEFSVITLACRLGHLYSSFPKDEPSLSYCPIRGDPLLMPFTEFSPTVVEVEQDLKSAHRDIDVAGYDRISACQSNHFNSRL